MYACSCVQTQKKNIYSHNISCSIFCLSRTNTVGIISNHTEHHSWWHLPSNNHEPNPTAAPHYTPHSLQNATAHLKSHLNHHHIAVHTRKLRSSSSIHRYVSWVCLAAMVSRVFSHCDPQLLNPLLHDLHNATSPLIKCNPKTHCFKLDQPTWQLAMLFHK